MPPRTLLIVSAISASFMLLAAPTVGHAQTQESPIASTVELLSVDSGWVRARATGDAGDSPARGVAFSTIVRAPGSAWVRLHFESATLGKTPPGGQSTVIRITSLHDGAQQTLTHAALQQWQNTTAYFNGDAVQVEVLADTAAPPSRVRIDMATCGLPAVIDEGGTADICLGVDDRALSMLPAVGRIMPIGCTAWIFDDPNRTFLTAGHCGPASGSVVQFNVPPSTSAGTPVHPAPEHQYAVDPDSVQRQAAGSGNDWGYFGCFPNSTTGLTPAEAQGAFYATAHAAPLDEPAQDIRITGFGTVMPPVALTRNQVQQTHTGPFHALVDTAVRYQVDTTGGNSGSPVFDETNGRAIGIHTHGACAATGANIGTAMQHAGLQNALANPRGVCVPTARLSFTFPDGVPERVSPAGDSLRVHIMAGAGGAPVPGTAMLHIDTGSAYEPIPMVEVAPNVYDAVFPPRACGGSMAFYIAAQIIGGGEARMPLLAPVVTYTAVSAEAVTTIFEDDFEDDLGWSVTSDPSLTTGAWQRTIPTAQGTRVPTTDADGSGKCFVTDNGTNDDIDGGATTLTSAPFDASSSGVHLQYWRWFSTSSISLEDSLRVEISHDNGATWLLVESCTSTGIGWYFQDVALDTLPGFTPSAVCRVRFIAADVGALSTVEAGVDGVRIRTIACAPPCPADLDADGTVSGADLGALLAAWGTGPAAADLNGDGGVDGADLGQLLSAWGPCPSAR